MYGKNRTSGGFIIMRYWIVIIALYIGFWGVVPYVVSAEEITTRRFAILNGGQLELPVPESWRDTTGPPSENIVIITFTPGTSSDFTVMITVDIPGPIIGTDYNSTGNIHEWIERKEQSLLTAAVKSESVFTRFSGQTGTGHYYSVMDPVPKPGEYEYTTHGEIRVGDLLLNFTVLSHEKDGNVLHDTLTMLAGARQQKDSAVVPDPIAPYELSLLTSNWSLVLDLSSFAILGRKTSQDQQGTSVLATNNLTGVFLSVFLETTPDLKTAQACREYYWSKSLKGPNPKTDIRLYETDQMALVVWTVQEYQGVKLQQRNISAYMAHEGVCLNLHLSKTSFRPGDQAQFDRILNSVTFQEKTIAP